MTDIDNLHNKIISVKDLLKMKELSLPIYQRPYKWKTKNVSQLIDDIYSFIKKSSYRLGSLVLYNNLESAQQTLDIVDGQQRLTTLLLILHAFIKMYENNEIKFVKSDRKHCLQNEEKIQLDAIYKELKNSHLDLVFNSNISKKNIQNNYIEIQRKLTEFDVSSFLFLFEKCNFVVFVLHDISEAFQFFDSQNSRGKDLEPHDLLKAFHLREFNIKDEQKKNYIVENWENQDTNKLSQLFSEYLYKIKNWTNGYSARFFTKNDIYLFKGINLDKIDDYPYTEQFRISHHFIDDFNQHYELKKTQDLKSFPFQLDQKVINGRRFFEMVTYYQNKNQKLKAIVKDNEIISVLDSYEGKQRTGDIYVRNLFNCGLLFYYDKFGKKDIMKAVTKIFIWAYKLRLIYQALYIASVDNYVLEHNLFRIIKEAINPKDVFVFPIEIVNEIKSTKTNKIKELFIKYKYLRDKNV